MQVKQICEEFDQGFTQFQVTSGMLSLRFYSRDHISSLLIMKSIEDWTFMIYGSSLLLLLMYS